MGIYGNEQRARGVGEEGRNLEQAKALTHAEEGRAEEVRKDLKAKEEEVSRLIESQRTIQVNLEALRARMIRAEKDAAAKEFLDKGY